MQYNSNLRLFTSAKRCAANKWPSNFLSAVFQVISYAATSQVFVPTESTDDSYVNIPAINLKGLTRHTALAINGIGLLIIGIGLLGQSLISVWYLAAGRKSVLSWSLNPINTALACLHGGLLAHRPGRGMMPLQSISLHAQPTAALKK